MDIIEPKKINLSEYTTIIGFIITIFAYIGINVLGQVFDYDGKFDNYKAVDWVIFVGNPVITAIIGSVAKGFLKQQGVLNAYKTTNVDKKHNEYIELIAKDTEYKPKHWKEAFARGSIKSFITAASFSICLSVLLSILGLDFSIEKVTSMFVTLGMWVSFGLADMNKMYTFVCTEQIGWYNKEIERIKNLKVDKSNGIN